MKPTEDEIVAVLMGGNKSAAFEVMAAADDTTLLLAAGTAGGMLREQRDEARAEVERLRYVLRVAHAHWDADRDVKVGKALVLGLRGEPVPSAPEVPAPTLTPERGSD